MALIAPPICPIAEAGVFPWVPGQSVLGHAYAPKQTVIDRSALSWQGYHIYAPRGPTARASVRSLAAWVVAMKGAAHTSRLPLPLDIYGPEEAPPEDMTAELAAVQPVTVDTARLTVRLTNAAGWRPLPQSWMSLGRLYYITEVAGDVLTVTPGTLPPAGEVDAELAAPYVTARLVEPWPTIGPDGFGFHLTTVNWRHTA